MVNNNSQHYYNMHRALDQDLTEAELEALNAELDESPESATQWKSLHKTDHLLRTTPMISPAPGFANRVMAALSMLDLPDLARRPLSVGIALGLAAAAVLSLPVLAVLLIVLLGVVTDPGALNTLLQAVANGMGYVVGFASDVGSEIRGLLTGNVLAPVLLIAIIPLTLVWGWVVRSLMRSGRLLTTRQKS